MTPTRRGFLGAIIAAAAAPAIVRATSLMPILVPRQDIIIRAMDLDLSAGDFTIEMWLKDDRIMPADAFKGAIDEFRVTKGLARFEGRSTRANLVKSPDVRGFADQFDVPRDGQFHHIALTRSNGSYARYVDMLKR